MPVLARRIISVIAIVGGTLLVTLLLPLLLVAALVASLFPASRGALPTLGFITAFLWVETMSLIGALWIKLRYVDHDQYIEANHQLKHWWAVSHKRTGAYFFRLKIRVVGEEALKGKGAILFPRHASIADTVIPVVYYGVAANIRLRYALKRELLWDPCLDIVGNRLPNFFVDRSGADTDRAVEGVRGLLDGMRDDEGVMIFVEGSRVTPKRRDALRNKQPPNQKLIDQLDRWPDLLPPRLGGVQALLESNPGRDVLFCAHVGFEGSSKFRDLINGSWVGADITIKFWRIPFADLPTDEASRTSFIFTQWDKMQETVAELK